jgi:MinD-like ATPase involved in chromosome partitioning or flagellar assembly
MPKKAPTERPYIIRMSSQKGGVGKTTIAVNLATALSVKGYRVLLVDADIYNPCITFYLGLRSPTVGFKDVLLGKSKLEKSDILYKPTGLHVLPEPETAEVPSVNEKYFDTFGKQLHKTDFHFVILDTSPSLMPEKLSHYDEALIVTTPELPAISSVVRLAKVFGKNKVSHNLVVNRFRGDIDLNDVKEVYGKKPIAVLPEDNTVSISLAEQVPAYLANKKAPFSTRINELVDYYSTFR